MPTALYRRVCAKVSTSRGMIAWTKACANDVVRPVIFGLDVKQYAPFRIPKASTGSSVTLQGLLCVAKLISGVKPLGQCDTVKIMTRIHI